MVLLAEFHKEVSSEKSLAALKVKMKGKKESAEILSLL